MAKHFLTPEIWAYRTNLLKDAYDLWNNWSVQDEIPLMEKHFINTIFGAIKYKINDTYKRQNFTEQAFFELTDLILALKKVFYDMLCKLNCI